MIKTKNYQRRFMRLVTQDQRGCWLWEGNINSDGYGRFGYMGKVMKAHRAGWLIFKGEIGQAHVLHKCDVKNCVNPKHLYLGTPKQNAHDKYYIPAYYPIPYPKK